MPVKFERKTTKLAPGAEPPGQQALLLAAINGKVQAMLLSPGELERVRRQLDDLVELRCRRRLSVLEAAEYVVLCAREAELLGLARP